MRQTAIACGLASAGLAAAYAAFAMLGAVAGGWSGETLRDQALGLALHGAVVLARGLLPTLLLTAALRALFVRAAGRPAGLAGTALLACGAAAAAVPAFLTSALGAWPRLQIGSTVDAAASIALLGLGSACAVLLAARVASPPEAVPAE